MKTKAVFSLLLAALTLTSVMASCGGDNAGTPPTVTDAVDNTATEAVETEETLKSLVPDGLDFGGETMRILSSSYFETDAFTMHVDEATGDVVKDAVYHP